MDSKGLALVTGADGGMGSIHTRTLAKEGYEVIMACYDAKVAEPVYEAIRQETGATLHLMQVDLGDLHDIIRFTDEVKSKFSSLKILLNNAGVLCHKAKNSVDNIEYTRAVNYLGHYTLTNALLPIMGPGTRVVSMVSIAGTYCLSMMTRRLSSSVTKELVMSAVKVSVTSFMPLLLLSV